LASVHNLMHLLIILQLHCIMFLYIFPLSYFYQYIAVMTSTKLVAMAMHKHDAMFGGRESILLTVIVKNFSLDTIIN